MELSPFSEEFGLFYGHNLVQTHKKANKAQNHFTTAWRGKGQSDYCHTQETAAPTKKSTRQKNLEICVLISVILGSASVIWVNSAGLTFSNYKNMHHSLSRMKYQIWNVVVDHFRKDTNKQKITISNQNLINSNSEWRLNKNLPCTNYINQLLPFLKSIFCGIFIGMRNLRES